MCFSCSCASFSPLSTVATSSRAVPAMLGMAVSSFEEAEGVLGRDKESIWGIMVALCVPVLLESRSTERVERTKETKSEPAKENLEKRQEVTFFFFLLNFATCETAMRSDIRSIG